MFRILFVSALLAALCIPAPGQAKPAGNAAHSWQIGAGFSAGPPDYTLNYLEGVTFYTSYEVNKRFDVTAEVHYMDLLVPQHVGQHSFVFGPRAGFTSRQFHFYIKTLIGFGLFDWQPGPISKRNGHDGYEVFAAGGGVEYLAPHHLNIRIGDFEYQGWPGFPPNGLTPWIASAGAAYRF